MAKDDLDKQYTVFDKNILRLENKEKVNDFENEVIVHITKLRENYSYLDGLIALGKEAKDKEVAQRFLSAFETYRQIASSERKKSL